MHLRIARPVSDLGRARTMYCAGLGLSVLGNFENHAGFDGIMLGRAGMQYHFEFTYFRTHPVLPSPTHEDLVIFYLPSIGEWQATCNAMRVAGFVDVRSVNPYWELHGNTFQDPDGYRIVLQNDAWSDALINEFVGN